MIILKHDLVIDVSQSNYTLMIDKHRQDKKGKPVYETLGYYITLIGAIRGARDYCIKQRLGDSDVTLHTALNEVKRICHEFDALLLDELGGAGNGQV